MDQKNVQNSHDAYRCTFCRQLRHGWPVNDGRDWLCFKCAGLPFFSSSTSYPETFMKG